MMTTNGGDGARKAAPLERFVRLKIEHGKPQPFADIALSACARCGGAMQRGIAIQNTSVAGMPDFAGDAHAITFSLGGPGVLIECLKCVECGHSVGA